MNGTVDASGRALLNLMLRTDAHSSAKVIAVWIDTGFTGELVLPRKIVDEMNRLQSGTVGAVLADGSTTVLATYTCIIEWFGMDRALEVVANAGEYPLLGIGLMIDRRLTIDYSAMTITLE